MPDVAEGDNGVPQEKMMAVKIIPAGQTIEDMRTEADECEQVSRTQPEPQANELKEKAALLREWISSLSTGRWTS